MTAAPIAQRTHLPPPALGWLAAAVLTIVRTSTVVGGRGGMMGNVSGAEPNGPAIGVPPPTVPAIGTSLGAVIGDVDG